VEHWETTSSGPKMTTPQTLLRASTPPQKKEGTGVTTSAVVSSPCPLEFG
ncbi:hypothetical protein BaRGS_00019361, partial [Batillaria attramentaria]